jgi:GrpB-like predicted nucleotidyltransferase (UPF0157 family)
VAGRSTRSLDNEKGGPRIDAPVQIEPYNTTWPAAFLAERGLLARVLERWLAGPIEHVGSTAVPGLAAKPVIDIMAPVKDLESSRPAIAELGKIGYCYAPYKADTMHWLYKAFFLKALEPLGSIEEGAAMSPA